MKRVKIVREKERFSLPVPLTDTGPHGFHGATAVRRVVEEPKLETDTATRPDMEGRTAKEEERSPQPATHKVAQLTVSGRPGVPGVPAAGIVVEEPDIGTESISSQEMEADPVRERELKHTPVIPMNVVRVL